MYSENSVHCAPHLAFCLLLQLSCQKLNKLLNQWTNHILPGSVTAIFHYLIRLAPIEPEDVLD